jgi:molecular chaperone DnaJ
VFGTIQQAVQCSECNGQGKRPEKACKQCKGTGVERKTSHTEVMIPAGIADGEAIRISGAGEYPGTGGRAGDLFVRIRVKPHPLFERDGYDVHTTVHVPYSTLLLGGEIKIDTIDGVGSLKIPEHTQPETIFKLRDKGIQHLQSSGRGDQLVTVQALVVKKLTHEQKSAIEGLRKVGL